MTRRQILLGAVVLTFSSGGLQALEPDLGGAWTMTILGSSPIQDKEADLSFERQGFNLQVNLQGAKAGSIQSVGYIDGSELRFYVIRPGKKGDVIAKFTGHVRGDLMGGEIDMGKQGMATWKAVRGPEEGVDLSGTWTLQMRGESPSGMNLVKMTFRQEGHNIVVTMQGEKNDVECEGFIDGRLITFYYVRPTDGEQFVAKFQGQLAGAYIGGEVDMGEHGRTTFMATRDI